jgi:hypothetical protein
MLMPTGINCRKVTQWQDWGGEVVEWCCCEVVVTLTCQPQLKISDHQQLLVMNSCLYL